MGKNPLKRLTNLFRKNGAKRTDARYDFYYRDLEELRNQQGDNTDFVFGKPYPILNERRASSGVMHGHYFHQDLLMARRVFENKPEKHVDIGSRTDGFIAHVASFREIELFDIRPQPVSVVNIRFKQANLMELPADMHDYCDSVSSLHAIEHFGLGRYGDPVDYYGHVKALRNIGMMLKQGGTFYFSVPIGEQRIEFNAHRVFNVAYLLALLGDTFRLDRFSYVDDKGALFEDVGTDDESVKNNYGCRYGCGLFELTKK